MIKNEIITEISRKEKYIRESIIIDSDKENKTDNIKENNINNIKKKYNIKKDNNNCILGVNYNKFDSLICQKKPINNSGNDKVMAENKENIEKNNIKIKKDLNNKIVNNSFHNINIEFQNNNSHKRINISNLSLSNIVKYEENNNEFKTLSNQSYKKKIYTPKNISPIFESNKEIKDFNVYDDRKKDRENNKKLNDNTPKNNVDMNDKKGNILFGSILVKNNSNTKNLKSFSLENDYNIKKTQKKKNNVNKKEKNNNILLKYSKEYKGIKNKGKNIEKNKENKNDLELIKVNKNENDILTKKQNEKKEEKYNKKISKEEDEKNNNIEIGYIKEMEPDNNVIPFNQTIFNKIIEEVKGEKNYIQKVVHRHIKNKRDLLRNSFRFNSYKKYDTNTYKEITTKRIRNPFYSLLNKESGNKEFINDTNENIKTDSYNN